jgi:hypothetical protein
MDHTPAGVASNRSRLLSLAYAAIVSGLSMAAIGGLGLAAGQPWLFPSLGPTIFIQSVTPAAPAARTWNTIAGHAIGVCAGFAALFASGAQVAPAVMASGALSPARVAATAAAVAATVGLQLLLKAQHPPAAATTMLVTLGGLKPDWRTVGVIAVGVVFIALLGALVVQRHPDRARA